MTAAVSFTVEGATVQINLPPGTSPSPMSTSGVRQARRRCPTTHRGMPHLPPPHRTQPQRPLLPAPQRQSQPPMPHEPTGSDPMTAC